MALPTGRHGALLSAQAKLLKAYAILSDLGLDATAGKVFAAYTDVNGKLGTKSPKAVKAQIEEDNAAE